MNQVNRIKPKPLKDFPVTTLLFSSFIALFAIQIFTGVDANAPTTRDLLAWGANTLSLSVINEPWRLLTAGFLHIGIMHLMFNGFAMYFFGQVAEKIWGRVQLLAVFLLSVIGGNLLNCYVAWQGLLEHQTSPGISAGASGGIMGIGAGLLICALLKIRVGGVQLNLGSLIMVMAFNLSYGFVAPGIDNAGHIGGAITGAILALVFSFTWKAKAGVQQVIFWSTVVAICAGFYYVWNDLHTALLPYLPDQ